MPDLYPSFEVPEEMVEETETEEQDVPAPLLTPMIDFETMEIAISPTGAIKMASDHDTYKQWVMKCIMTERYEYFAYSTDFGVETEDIIRSDYPRDVAESEIQRTITEALMVDARTVSVDNFTFEWRGDSVWVSLEVESIYGRDTIATQIGGV